MQLSNILKRDKHEIQHEMNTQRINMSLPLPPWLFPLPLVCEVWTTLCLEPGLGQGVGSSSLSLENHMPLLSAKPQDLSSICGMNRGQL